MFNGYIINNLFIFKTYKFLYNEQIMSSKSFVDLLLDNLNNDITLTLFF